MPIPIINKTRPRRGMEEIMEAIRQHPKDSGSGGGGSAMQTIPTFSKPLSEMSQREIDRAIKQLEDSPSGGGCSVAKDIPDSQKTTTYQEWLAENEWVKAQCLNNFRRYVGIKKYGLLDDLKLSVERAKVEANLGEERVRARREFEIGLADNRNTARFKQAQAFLEGQRIKGDMRSF